MAPLIFFFILAFPHAEYRLSLHEELMEMRGHVLELATGWLSDSNAALTVSAWDGWAGMT